MAARENQGLQIGLIVFAATTIVLVVSTYFFFSRYREQTLKTDAATAAASTAMADKDKATKDRSDLLALIGAGASDSVTDVVAAEKAKIAPYAPTQQTFDKAIDGLKAALAAAKDTVKATQDTMARDKSAYQASLEKASNDVNQYKAASEDAAQKLNDQTTKYNTSLADLQKTKDDLQTQLGAARHQVDQVKSEAQAAAAKLGVENTKLASDNQSMKKTLDQVNKPNPQVSGGRIVLVDTASNTVYLSLGSDDGLKRKTSFNVYPRGTVNVSGAASKGQIEVTKIDGPHSSEARIVSDAIRDPLLPNDMVHSSEWAPGQHAHYAIAGVIDLRGDGSDSTQQLKEMIEASGGVVDAWVQDYRDTEGKIASKVQGAIDYNTRYLVAGGGKTFDTPEAAARAAPTQALQKAAAENHVEQIGLDKFLYRMGYVTPDSAGPSAAGRLKNVQHGSIKGFPNDSFGPSVVPREPPGVPPADGGNPE